MEYVSYQLVSENTGSLNTGSYLNKTGYSLFVNGFVTDLWYGVSENDHIEMGVYDISQNQIAWGILNQNKEYKTNQFSYLNTLDFPVTYSYEELQPDFILYKNDKILISPPQQLSESFGILDGNYMLTYNFTREMAGTPLLPLTIKDISPSRTEIKLIPVGKSTPQYDAFCNKKFLIGDVSPLYLQFTKNCPYGDIYNKVSRLYISEINTLKSLFFLTTDGEVLNFLKNLYEDFIIYTNTPTDSSGNIIGDPEKLLRIQGIRTYFSNYLQSNIESISDFTTIDTNYKVFVSASVERKFVPIGKNPSREYVDAKRFIYEFFTEHFYFPITQTLSDTFNAKYFSQLKNALNIGNGKLFPVVNHGFLDERLVPTDPLTLIIKLQSELDSNVNIGTNGWISNISLVPYVISSIIKDKKHTPLISIGPPNFSAITSDISVGHVNKSYSADDLNEDPSILRELSVSKKQETLNVNYTDFKNFVVFSSAEVRLNIFKNKMIRLSTLTSSLQVLEDKNVAFLSSSGSTYPFYENEYNTLQGEMTEIVTGFDGYESYLYRGNGYLYVDNEFISSSYVAEMDTSASYYDKNNRDSLINNTPAHILETSDNDDYIVFLSMIGHYFDEIYSYISNLPSEKAIGEGESEMFARTVTDYMLDSFGWKLDDTMEETDLLYTYLNSSEVARLDSMSLEERTKVIRNRILLNLPQIYKTKGTEEAIKMLLLCYGIPTSLLNIREYGGVNYTDENASYTQLEKAYMYQWDTSSIYDHFRTEYPGMIKTIEYKFSIPDPTPYSYGKEQIQWGVIEGGVAASSISGSGLLHGGFVRERGPNMGRVYFSVGYKGFESIKVYSDIIPIFDGEVYSVMIRKNLPDENYEYSTTTSDVPIKYDLYVQRNISGRPIVQSKTSYMNYDSQSNYVFDNNGVVLMIGGWFAWNNGQGYTGTFDKMLWWIDPITDSNFEDHVNNINSYAFSGSRDGYKSLVYRMHTDYPFDLNQNPPGTISTFFGTSSRWWGTWFNASPYYTLSPSINSDRFEAESGTPVGGGSLKCAFMDSWAAWSGSQKLVYDSVTCQNISQSTYPYQFKIIEYPCTYTISKYGPNRFRNEKIRRVSQSLDVRVDVNNRSTYFPQNNTAADSNLVGVFVDPQDFKNKDILRYFGNFNFMDIIGAPQNSFSSSYDQLRGLRKKYANIRNDFSGSNPRFGEMLTLYKLYFNRSVFETIKNLVPARSNVLTGIIIEPTILERPKYQSKPINSELNVNSVFYADITASKYFRDPNTKVVKISTGLEHGNFNIDTSLLEGTQFETGSLPNNLYFNVDLSYINEPNVIYPRNYLPNGSDINDFPDKYQFGHFGTNAFLCLDGGVEYGKIPVDMNYNVKPTGSQKLYLMKQWDTYTISAKTNQWVRNQNPKENLYSTNSIQLYKYIVVSDTWFNSVVYTGSINITTLPDAGNHVPNTFKNTPNSNRNNIKADPIEISPGVYIMGNDYYVEGNGSHLELVSGYPRNHYIHKRTSFSPYKIQKLGKDGNMVTSGSYIRSQQTIDSTIGEDGLETGDLPVQTFDVSNVNLQQSDNVIN